MEIYLAQGIIEGRLDYKAVFTNPKLKQFKEDVDMILVASGNHDKIVTL